MRSAQLSRYRSSLDICVWRAEKVAPRYESGEFNVGIEAINALATKANLYFQTQQPWQKYATKLPRCVVNHLAVIDRGLSAARRDTALFIALETLRVIATLLQPVIPDASKRILDVLSVPDGLRTPAACS